MQDQPSATSVLTAIAILLRDELLPKLEGRPAFQARVAANALDIVARELEHAPQANAQEEERLKLLLDSSGDLVDLNRQLCRRIAAGEMTTATPGLVDHLWRTTLDKLLIDQPNYASYRRVLEETRAAPRSESAFMRK